jgi:acylphosphatase
VKRARVRVTGLVQGVYFRAETRDRARSLGIAGWVSNAPDGAVQAVFEGQDDRVDAMVAWCGRGPAGARVDSVSVEWEQPAGERRFRIVA